MPHYRTSGPNYYEEAAPYLGDDLTCGCTGDYFPVGCDSCNGSFKVACNVCNGTKIKYYRCRNNHLMPQWATVPRQRQNPPKSGGGSGSGTSSGGTGGGSQPSTGAVQQQRRRH